MECQKGILHVEMYESMCISFMNICIYIIPIWYNGYTITDKLSPTWFVLKDFSKPKRSSKIGEKVISRKCGAIKYVVKSRCTKLHNDYQDDLSRSAIRLS